MWKQVKGAVSRITSRRDERVDPFFRAADEGRELFYPWGYPGEAFYIRNEQRRLVTGFGDALTVLWVGIALWIVFGGSIYFAHIALVAHILSSVVYVLLVYTLTKGLEVYVVPTENRITKPIALIVIMVGLPTALYWMRIAQVSLADVRATFAALTITHILLVCHFVWSIKRTKGYYITE